MGTIAEKLTYLNETKSELKDSINNLGGNITSETTFREYATELQDIYDNIPKTSGEDSNLSLTTIKGRIQTDKLEGNTSQNGTPTPSTPINIDVVTGEQVVKVENVNLYKGYYFTKTTGGITFTYNTDGSVNASGTTSGSASTSMSLAEGLEHKFILRTGTYTLSGATAQMFIQIIDSSGNEVTITNATTFTKTFTLSENKEVFLRYRIPANTNISGGITIYPMLQVGSTATTYTPHQEQTQTISLSSKNLFDNTTTGLFCSGCTASLSNDTITITATQNGDIYVGNVRASGSSYVAERGTKIYVQPSTQYVVSLTNNAVNKIFITEFNNSNVSLGYTQANTITTSANTSYITIRYGLENAVNGTSYSTKIMVEKGSTATTYEQYYNIELCKIGNYQDYIYKSNDKWYKKGYIGKVVFTGANSEGWVASRGTSPYVYEIAINDYMRTNELTCICDHFLAVTNGTYGAMTDGQCRFRYYSDSNNMFYVCTTNSTNVTNFKTWLASNNTDLRYVLATATDTEITNTSLINQLNNIEKLMSYNGTTNISVSGNLPIILNVKALKGE